MSYQYVTINGQRVEKTVAEAFDRMNRAFYETFTLHLIVSSGTRTREEQQRLYTGWIKRLPGYNLAAAPGWSNHEESGPSGPRALDLRDTGSDAGVTVLGSARSNWLRRNAPSFGFECTGIGFKPREPWHYEYLHPLNVASAQPAPVGDAGLRLTNMRWYGIQKMLKRDFGYSGNIDNIAGVGSVKAFQRFMNAKGYGNLIIDGIDGTETVKAAQRWLKKRWGYSGNIDGIIGAGTGAAWQRAETGNWNAYK